MKTMTNNMKYNLSLDGKGHLSHTCLT